MKKCKLQFFLVTHRLALKSHTFNWTFPPWRKVKQPPAAYIDLVVIIIYCIYTEDPELYADTSKKFSNDFIQCTSAVVGDEFSALTLVPEDKVFSVLSTTMQLAEFSLPEAGNKATKPLIVP